MGEDLAQEVLGPLALRVGEERLGVGLFDEPTSAFDPEMVNEVLDVMVGLARQGMTMIVVTHEMGFARKAANRVVFMADGQIVEESDPESFFTNPQSERAQDFLSKILTH